MEIIGEMAAHADTLIAASHLRGAPEMHVDQLRKGLITIRDTLRDVYIQETGDDPWAE